ncbi:Hypothetical predicted protein [Paramuricea clavata]|uniref:Uncharacterized protein n=1 Tax=Paramuricea clavata TaxID=317549 RepID=A0A7D9LUT3_PARCT|nr:Hypothetical predicted protein [Paramuricea clavata]
MALLPDFPLFNVHEDSNAGSRWKKWLTRFERLLCGLNITADKRKTALLLHYAGSDVDDIYDTLPTSSNEDYKTVVEKLNQYFSPKLMWLSKFLTSAKRNRNPTSPLILIILDYAIFLKRANLATPLKRSKTILF